MREVDLIDMFKGAKWRRNVVDHSIAADFRMNGGLMHSICDQTRLFLDVGMEAVTRGDATTITFKGEETLKQLVRKGFNNFPGASDYITPAAQV